MKRFGIIALLTLGFTVVLASISFAGLAYAYRDAYYPGVRVAGISLAGKTQLQANQEFSERFGKISSRPVTVLVDDITAERDPVTGAYPKISLQSTAAELGLDVDVATALSDAYAIGRQPSPIAWLRSVTPALFSAKNQPARYSLDSTKVRSFVETEVAPKVISPQPAKLSIVGTDIQIEDQKPGTKIDTEALSSDLIASLPDVLDGDAAVVRAKVSLVDAEVSRTTLQPLVTRLNLLSNLSVRMTDEGDGALVPTKAQMLSFFTPVQAEDGTLGIDVNATALSSYIRVAGPKELDVDKSTTEAAKNLRLAIVESEQVSEVGSLQPRQFALKRKPARVVTPGTFTLGRFEGKYIEVNLAEQKLYRIEGSTLVKTYTISSGKWSTPTPRGTFTIAGKHPRAYSASFGLYMPYWMNIVGTPDGSDSPLRLGEYGLHELPEWPNGYKEGQSHLGTPVSHGCVRLGVGDAAELYAWADSGTKVVIY